MQASQKQKRVRFPSRFRDGWWDSGSSLLLYLEVFRASSQQQTDTQETAEDRQPVLVTSEGEARGGGGALRGA